MVLFSGSEDRPMKSGNESGEKGCSDDDHDGIPLKQRLKKLRATKCLMDSGETKSEKEGINVSTPPIDFAVKDDDHCDSQGSDFACLVGESEVQRLPPKGTHAGKLEYNSRETEANKCIALNQIRSPVVNSGIVRAEKLGPSDATSLQHAMPPKYIVKVKVECTENTLMSSLGNCLTGSSSVDTQAIKMKHEVPDDFSDDLDNMVLKERQKMLLSRKSLGLTKPVLEGNFSKLSSSFVDDRIQYSAGIDKRESHSGYKESSIVGNESWESDSSNGVIARPSCMISQIPMLAGHSQGTESTKPGGFVSSQKDDRICSHKKIFAKYEHCDAQHPLSGSHKISLASDLSTFLNVKVEPLDKTEVQSPDKNAVGNFSCSNIGPAESELELPDETYEDIFDHMVLRDRMMLLASRKFPCLQSSGNFECSGKVVPSFLDSRPIESDCAKPQRINRLRKRRKTATDSVQTALEEDAPGLLQVLIDKGVSVNEIKLYGEMESENALDDSSTEDSFTELEAVIAKLFSRRHSLLKFASLRCPKDEKASYCLACLISLVEQAHYLQFKKWPVEWGWCRDLQSFIFVFERHNRIVLERPEYGYATYFFELVDSLTISWQVRRLVTAMKLTSCSRATLIENKALVVGEDLSEGEARVLTQYGWIPNSGLGTMLNYCDRVVHDRKNESDSSEWRSKIGKLLMDGYNGGTIVPTDIPIKVVEYGVAQSPQIKLEL